MFCMHQCTCEPFLRSDDELGKIFMFIFGIFALDFFYVKYDNRRTNMQHLSLAMASSYNFKPVIKKVTLFGKVFLTLYCSPYQEHSQKIIVLMKLSSD